MSTPTLGEAINSLVEYRLQDLHVAMPAKVLEYDSSNQSITAQPLVKRGYVDENGERQVESLPAITNVPVVFPGAGAISITWPIAVGSTVLLVFSEFSIDKWLRTGTHSDPNDDRRHALSDAIAIPGLRPLSNPVTAVHSTAMVIDAPLIHAAGTSALALKADVDELRSKLNAHMLLTPGALGHTTTLSTPAAAMTGTTKLKGS